MKIIIDSRERSILDFPYEFVSETIVKKLEIGDYGVRYEDGFEPRIYFERKSINDLFGTLGKGYKRFKKEIEKSKQLDMILIIIIEKPLSTVLKGLERSNLSGESIIRKLFTLFIKHNIYTVFCRDREECSRYIYEFFSAIGRLKNKQSKEIGTNNAELSTLRGEGNIQTVRTKIRSNNRRVII